MTFGEYQELARRTAAYHGNRLYPVLALGEEAGEVQRLFAKDIRDGGYLTEEKLVAELGDVLWQVANIAADAGIHLDDVARFNVAKLKDRAARGVIGGDGDDR